MNTSPRLARTRRLLLSCSGVLIACTLSACGGDSGSTSVATPTTSTTQTPTPAGTATPPTPAASDAALKADMRCAP